MDIFEKPLSDGTFAYAFFNFGASDETVSAEANGEIRDLWAKESISHNGSVNLDVPLHTAKIIKSSKRLIFKQ